MKSNSIVELEVIVHGKKQMWFCDKNFVVENDILVFYKI